ncbi:MAG: DUF4169 family protein [Caulobacter sp.]|nr:DUF4169 family protein [Caulobacter sp.]
MSEVINLNKARKARSRADAKTTAAQNRARFGRTGVDRALDAARRDKADKALDGAKRED